MKAIIKNDRVKKNVICVVVIVCCAVLLYLWWPKKASWYTEDQHIQRVSNLIDKKYLNQEYYSSYYDEKYTITGYEIYPLYNLKDELEYCLVECQPYGYIYVHIEDEHIKLYGTMWHMYTHSAIDRFWKTNFIDYCDDNIVCKQLEDGMIAYYQSPYNVNNVLNEKKYLITYCLDANNSSKEYIPAIKQDGGFINLYTNKSFMVESGKIKGNLYKGETIDFFMFYGKQMF